MAPHETVLQILIIGIANGSLIALIALGYTMVYGIIELINFAHGDVFMIGTMVALSVVTWTASAAGVRQAFLLPAPIVALLLPAMIIISMAACALPPVASIGSTTSTVIEGVIDGSFR